MRDGHCVAVEVTADGAGAGWHTGSALLAGRHEVRLTSALSHRLGLLSQGPGGGARGPGIRHLAVMLDDRGECVADLGGQRDQETLFGPVASDSTAFRVIDRLASTPGLLDAVRAARARTRARFWELGGTPQRLTIDVERP